VSRSKSGAGFTLVEVAVAIGVIAFALLTLVALLPIGMKSNQISAEETRAVSILSAVEADLRNTHPSLESNGRSNIFGLDLPFAIDPITGRYQLNPALTPRTVTLGDGATIGLSDAESPVPLGSNTARFQVSVIYMPRINPGSPETSRMDARLVVSWPPLATAGDASQVTDVGRTSGFVEALASFRAPLP
jgi:type II secretory pathway pseudopilin PulG